MKKAPECIANIDNGCMYHPAFGACTEFCERLIGGAMNQRDVSARRELAVDVAMLESEGAQALQARIEALEKALRGLLYVIENDDLVPESVSYMKDARAALELPAPLSGSAT